MYKSPVPEGWNEHENGDFDGLGCFRGLMTMLPISLALWGILFYCFH